MSTYVVVNTYTHTVTHVAARMMLTLKEIIRGIGLDPGYLTDQWPTLERGLTAWLTSQHLQRVVLEIFHPTTKALVARWDLDVIYGYTGDGSLWADTDAIRYSIAKAGLVAGRCEYRIVVTTKPGRPAVDGWGPATLKSTDGFTRYAVGSTIGGNGIAAQAAYWVKR